MKQKFHVHVRGGYVGTTLATLAEIKTAFPYAEIRGSRVDVWSMAPRA